MSELKPDSEKKEERLSDKESQNITALIKNAVTKKQKKNCIRLKFLLQKKNKF